MTSAASRTRADEPEHASRGIAGWPTCAATPRRRRPRARRPPLKRLQVAERVQEHVEGEDRAGDRDDHLLADRRVPDLAQPARRAPGPSASARRLSPRGSPSQGIAAGASYCGAAALAGVTAVDVAQRAADLLGRDHAAEPALGVDRDKAAEPAQVVVAEQRLERRVVADVQLPPASAARGARATRAASRRLSGTASAAPRWSSPTEALRRHRRPGTRASGSAGSTRRAPVRRWGPRGSRPDRRPSRRRPAGRSIRLGDLRLHGRRAGRAEHEADQRQPDAADHVALDARTIRPPWR